MQEEASGFAAFVGIDWADRKHDVCLQVPGADAVEVSVVEHRPKAIEEWAHKLRERFAGQRIAVCIELSDGPIVSALLEHDIFVIYPVNPSTLAKYRRAFTPSRAKDDPTDAAIALELSGATARSSSLCATKVRTCARSGASSRRDAISSRTACGSPTASHSP